MDEEVELLLDLRERLKVIEKVRVALSNELRTSLSVIVSYAHAVSQGKVGSIGDVQREMLERLMEQAFEIDTLCIKLGELMRQLKEAEEEIGRKGGLM